MSLTNNSQEKTDCFGLNKDSSLSLNYYNHNVRVKYPPTQKGRNAVSARNNWIGSYRSVRNFYC